MVSEAPSTVKASGKKSPSPPPAQSPTKSLSPPAEFHDDAEPIDADSFGDADSAVGDSLSTYTASLASSVVNYPVEYGRRYHAYQPGKYFRPNDEIELDRLVMAHSMFSETSGGLFLAPVDMEQPQRILDIGTGPGIWAIEVADMYPNVTVLGNDLSATMPTLVPPNIKFEVDDVEEEWTYEEPFSFIFCRYMVGCINDWTTLLGRAYSNLEPGGWIEVQDPDLKYYSEDGSLKPDDPLKVWSDTATDAMRKKGQDPCTGSKMAGWLAEAGFTNIVHRRFRMPIGPWARDPRLKSIGMHFYMQLNLGLEGMSLRLWTQIFKWKPEEVMVMTSNVRKTLGNPSVHPMLDYHITYGQKPLH